MEEKTVSTVEEFELDIASMTINERLVRIMQQINAIAKNRPATAGSATYNFRGIDDILNTCHPLFAEYGVFILPEVLEFSETERTTKNGSAIFYTKLKVKYTFVGEKGDQISAIGMGEAMDSGDKSTNKAMSAALKYVLTQVLLIPTEDPKDSENDTYEIMTTEKQTVLQQFFVKLDQLESISKDSKTKLEKRLKEVFKQQTVADFTLPQLKEGVQVIEKTIILANQLRENKLAESAENTANSEQPADESTNEPTNTPE